MNLIVAGPHVTPVAYGLVRGAGCIPDADGTSGSCWHATPVPIRARHAWMTCAACQRGVTMIGIERPF
jgi:hypothetical protein